MKKRTKLKCCNIALLISLVPLVVSAVLLECLGGADLSKVPNRGIVHIHLAFALITTALVFWHLQLHFGNSHWSKKIKNLKSHVTKWLVRIALISLASGLIALVLWIVQPVHNTIGGVHGKICLIFLVVAAGHALKRRKFYTNKKRQ